jgi:hypothetical protein
MKPVSHEGLPNLQENPDQGKILLFHQNFSECNQIPHNLFSGAPSATGNSLPGKIYQFFWGEQKSEVVYDPEKRIVHTSRRIRGFPWVYSEKFFFLFHFTQSDAIKTLFKIFFLRDIQKTRSLYICGLVPMTKCDFTIELEKKDEKGFVILQTPGARIVVDRKNPGEYTVDSFFDSPSKKFVFKRLIVPTKKGKLFLKVSFDGKSKTNTISGNDQNPILTPFHTLSSSQLNYPSFSHGYIKISTIAMPDQGSSSTFIYSVSQSAPRKMITPIGDKNIQPLGFDGPHQYTCLKKGIAYMEKWGYRGTIWFDIEYLKDEQYVSFLKTLMFNKSWEAGIHYSKSLTALPLADAIAMIADEYDSVSSPLDTFPKSWCSLRSRDSVFFANLIFEKFKMIWRGGDSGDHAEPYVGNLDDSTWDWWSPATRAGIIYPVFTHQTDREPAIPYSISFSKFKDWIDNYQANGISIIPFGEWWRINANTNDMLITNLSLRDNTVTFRVKTNGERGVINVNTPGTPGLEVLDHNSHTIINWTQGLDDSIIFSVESDHEYEIRNFLKS